MSTDFEIQRCRPEPTRAALAGLAARFPGVSVVGVGTEFKVGVFSFHNVAHVSLFATRARISGKAGPLLAFIAQATSEALPGSRVWDPQAGAPLKDAPTWAAVQTFVHHAEHDRDGDPLPVPVVPASTEVARRFLTMLVEQELVELDADLGTLPQEVATILDGPARGRAAALESLLLKHPAVVELFTERDTLQELLDVWV